MKIWRVRYSFDGLEGYTEKYYKNEKRAMEEGRAFEQSTQGGMALILEITVCD